MSFKALDAGQLVKHAFGLSTAASRIEVKKRVFLFYRYYEPRLWPDGRPIPRGLLEKHRTEVAEFAKAAAGAEVCFSACTYVELIEGWAASPDRDVREHALALAQKFEL